MFGSQSFKWYANPVKIEACKKRVRKTLSRLRFRRAVCDHYKITVTEYEKRFEDWRYLRRLYVQHFGKEKARADREAFIMRLTEKRQDQASRKAQTDAERLIEGITDEKPNGRLKAVFPGDE